MTLQGDRMSVKTVSLFQSESFQRRCCVSAVHCEVNYWQSRKLWAVTKCSTGTKCIRHKVHFHRRMRPWRIMLIGRSCGEVWSWSLPLKQRLFHSAASRGVQMEWWRRADVNADT